MKRFFRIFSLPIAALLVLAVYLAAWLPALSPGFQVSLAEESGDRAALEGFRISGGFGEDYQQASFILTEGRFSHSVSAQSQPELLPHPVHVIPRFAEEVPSQGDAGSMHAANTTLLWEVIGDFVPSTTNGGREELLRIDTGLTYPADATLPDPHPSIAEAGGEFYVVPLVPQGWEGTRFLYRVEEWRIGGMDTLESVRKPAGRVVPVTAIEGGEGMDLFYLGATLDGMLTLFYREGGGCACRIYDPSDGSLQAELAFPGMPEGEFFRFFPDDGSFCIALNDPAENSAYIAAARRTDSGWQITQPVRKMENNGRVRAARQSPDGRLALLYETPYQLPEMRVAVGACIWDGGSFPLYSAIFTCPAEDDFRTDGVDGGTPVSLPRRSPENLQIDYQGGNG